MAKAKDVETVEATPAVVSSLSRFDELAAGAAVVDSVDNVLSNVDDKVEDNGTIRPGKKRLQEVPLAIDRAIYRTGEVGGQITRFVSLEAVVGPNNFGDFAPDSRIVINDGSTGIYRQVTSYIESQGWIRLPEGPTTGKSGETRYEAPYEQWETLHEDAEVRFSETGDMVISVHFPRVLVARHGVRVSEYADGDSKTCYLA